MFTDFDRQDYLCRERLHVFAEVFAVDSEIWADEKQLPKGA
jgi:hypothetical protein